MRSKLVAAGIVVLGIFMLVGQPAQAAPQGVTITPAALRLELAEHQEQAKANFTVTNNYPAAVTLAFGLEPGEGSGLSEQALAKVAFLSEPLVTIEAGESFEQSVVFVAGENVPPGSQLATITVNQQGGAAATGATVASSIRLPLVLVRLDGAVSSYTVSSVSTNGSALSVPSEVTAVLKNTGNMQLIPRGVLSLQDPRGNSVAHGVLNESSLALSPGGNLTLKTNLLAEASPMWPGPYRLTVSYGLGAGTSSDQVTVTVWYVAWWHLALLLGLVAGLYFGIPYGKRRWRSWKAHRHKQPPRPKRPALIGRDIS